MKKSDSNMVYFGIYVFFLGLLFIAYTDSVFPHFLYDGFKHEWVKLIGVAFLGISLVTIVSVVLRFYWFYYLSSVAKAAAFFWISGFYLLGYVSLPIVLIGVIDIASGLWVLKCMRNENISLRRESA